MDKSVNILVLGKAGVGKSSFLNYLVDKDVFETGIGEPVTKTGFHETSYLDEKTGISFNLIDTAGIEPDNINSFKELIFNKIDDCNSDINVSNWMHTIYYCISASSKRVEPYEIELIKELSKRIHVILILTKVDLVADDLLNEIKKELRLKVGNSIDICAVCNVQIETRLGQTVRFGKEEVLEYSFMGLWTTLSRELPAFTKNIFVDLTNTITSLTYSYLDNINLVNDLTSAFEEEKSHTFGMTEDEFQERMKFVYERLIDLNSVISLEISNYLNVRFPFTINSLYQHIDQSLDTSIEIYSSFMSKNLIDVKEIKLNKTIDKFVELKDLIYENVVEIYNNISVSDDCKHPVDFIIDNSDKLVEISNNIDDLFAKKIDIAINTLEMEVQSYAEYVVRK